MLTSGKARCSNGGSGVASNFTAAATAGYTDRYYSASATNLRCYDADAIVTAGPSAAPTRTGAPSAPPLPRPSASPVVAPTEAPSAAPRPRPSAPPVVAPTATPSAAPTAAPSAAPTGARVIIALRLELSGVASCNAYGEAEAAVVDAALAAQIAGTTPGSFGAHVCADGSRRRRALLSGAVEITTSATVDSAAHDGGASAVLADVAAAVAEAVSSGALTSAIEASAAASGVTSLALAAVTAVDANTLAPTAAPLSAPTAFSSIDPTDDALGDDGDDAVGDDGNVDDDGSRTGGLDLMVIAGGVGGAALLLMLFCACYFACSMGAHKDDTESSKDVTRTAGKPEAMHKAGDIQMI